MVMNADDTVPLTQSPSITQETKARFNELLNAALTRETVHQTQAIRIISSTPNNKKSQPEAVPKAFPRQKLANKTPAAEQYAEKHNISSINSSDDSCGGKRVERQVVVEVHNSNSHLIISSSDDDILAEKKDRKKKKKSRWKRVSETVQQIEVEGEINQGFQLNEDSKGSPSRLSNRSYTLETPTFPIEDMKKLASKINNHGVSNTSKGNTSPSRISNRSYVLETPTFPLEATENDQPILPKVKTPIPLPRRKSLKPSPCEGEDAPEIKPSKEDVVIRSERSETIIIIPDSASQVTEDDVEHSGSTPVVKLQDTYTEEDIEYPIAVKKQRKRKKRRKISKSREEVELQEFNTKVSSKKEDNLTETFSRCSTKGDAESLITEETLHNSGDPIVGVTIHGVDCPLVDSLVRHPVVRLYVVDTTTGEYYVKSDHKRMVCYYGENTRYIQPIMTHPFDFKLHKSVIPEWDECLVLNESSPHLLTQNTLLLFELCDFVTPVTASSRYRTLGSSSGWHIIAWAFLRSLETSKISAKMRLQLYKPSKRSKNLHTMTPLVYEWWGTATRRKYSGCLYVTVSLLDPVEAAPSPKLRSRLPMQAEQGSANSVRSTSALASEDNSQDGEELVPQENNQPESSVVWSRLPAQSCKIPNCRFRSLPVDGSMCVRFSNNGLWLASAKEDVTVYNVPQFQLTSTLRGHQGLVYSLHWSSDSKILLSASADCTVCVWKPNHRRAPLLQVLAHPSFTYCAQFVPTPGYCSVVSGCYDGILRLWQGETHNTYRLTQELSGHSGFVTSICVSVDGTKVISADSVGCVRICDVEEDGSLSTGRELRVREVRGVTINNIVTHPGGHRILVHSRDSCVHSVDLATGAVIQTFKGTKNSLLQTGFSVTPCGSLVFSCSEDGSLVVWNSLTGAIRAVYCSILPSGSASVHYHPYEHLLAVGSLGQSPVHVLSFDRNTTGEDIGLTLFKSEITATTVIETIKTLQSSNKWQKVASKVIQNSSEATVHGKGKNKKETEESDKNKTKSTKWPSLPQLESQFERSSEDKDLRLLEIIKRMDTIILAAQQSSQA